MINEIFQIEKMYRRSILILALIFVVPAHLFDYLQMRLFQNGSMPFLLTIASLAIGFWGGFFVFSVYHLIIENAGKSTLQITLKEAGHVLRYYLTLLVRSIAFIVLVVIIMITVSLASPEWIGTIGFRAVSSILFWLWSSYLFFVFLLLPATYAAHDCDRRDGARAASRVMIDNGGQLFTPYALLHLLPSLLVILISLAAPENAGAFVLRMVLSIAQTVLTALLMVRAWQQYSGAVGSLLINPPGADSESAE